jgi:hypothetical protein
LLFCMPGCILVAMLGRTTTAQWMIFVALYGVVFWSITLFGGNMQNSVVDLTAAIVEDGRFSIDPYHTNSPDTAFKDGHYYSGMAPGASFLAIPCYIASKVAWKLTPELLAERINRYREKSVHSQYSLLRTPHAHEQVATHILMTLIFGHLAGALSLFLIVRIGQSFGADPAMALRAALAYCLATPIVYYHASYYTQSMANTFLLLAAFFFCYGERLGWRALAAGFAAGLAGSIDYPFFVYGGLLVALAVFFGGQSVTLGNRAALVAGCAIPLALVMLCTIGRASAALSRPRTASAR